MVSLILASPRLLPVQRAVAVCLRHGSYYSTDAHRRSFGKADPLQILFCGSDEFSTTSLNSLVDIYKRDKSLIESIIVLCRPDKRVGAGLKKINEGLPSYTLHRVSALMFISSCENSSPGYWLAYPPNRQLLRV
jgi:hypothetical protein